MQEALTNVARHSGASKVELSLSRLHGACVLCVRDNGLGVDTGGERKTASFGLLGIRERARLFGGSVAMQTAPGQGFSLTVALSLAAIEQLPPDALKEPA